MFRRSKRCAAWTGGAALLCAPAFAQPAPVSPQPPAPAPAQEAEAQVASSPLTPPELLSEPRAPWPARRELSNDLLVPVLLTVSRDGSVEAVELEAGVGEPFDSAALQAARAFRFVPARDATGPRRARVRTLVRFVAAAPPVPAAGSEQHPEPALEVTVQGAEAPRSASETVQERPLLAAAPHRDASEMLLVVPGIFVSQHGGEGKAHQIFVRGFDAVHGQDVEIWAGGAPVNEVSNLHGQGYADLHFLIPEVVERIHSTPGVYDPRQGDFAVAGSLRFDLGYAEPGVTASAGLGSFGARRLFMAYHPEGASSQTFGAFELESSDGFGPSRAARHGSAIVQARHDLGAVSARWLASAYAGRFDSAGVLRLEDIESGRVGRLDTYDGKQGGYSARTQLVLQLENGQAGAEQGDSWSLSPYLGLRTLRLRSNFTGYLTSIEGDSLQQLHEALTLGVVAHYRRALGWFSPRDHLEAGVSLRSDAIRQSQHRLSLLDDRVTDDEQSPGVVTEVRALDSAGYLDLELHPLRRLSLRGGLRVDALSYLTEEQGGQGQGQARSALGAQLSRRLTLDLTLLPGLHALLSYGEGFRSPQARSLGDGETTPFTRVNSYEAGLRLQRGELLQASLATFLTDLSDDLVFEPATARNELVPSTRRMGVAGQLVSRPLPELLASASVTYARAALQRSGGPYTRGDLLPYVPQLVARLDLAYTPLLARFFERDLRGHFGAAVTGLGRRPLPYAELGHDALLADVRAALRFGPLETSLDVYNLLDTSWYDGEFVYSSRFGDAPSLVPVRHVTVGPPRTLLWSLALRV